MLLSKNKEFHNPIQTSGSDDVTLVKFDCRDVHVTKYVTENYFEK